MLPTIGLMIGAYIITRMIDIGNRKDSSVVVKVFCALTLLFTVFCMFSLATASTSASSSLP
jgi:hypothetical protein